MANQTRPTQLQTEVNFPRLEPIDTLHGRVRTCARDLVGECRRCGTIVCRGQNCVAKSSAFSSLKQRYRRLCRACQVAPLHGAAKEFGQLSGDNLSQSLIPGKLQREFCNCPAGIHICVPCGNVLKAADTTYMRGWTWRTRYSTFLGGLGTGIGEGNQGVHCGREAFCLATNEIEKEIDCDATEQMALQEAEHFNTPGRAWALGTSYLTQEIEGIGGIVKKKVKKRIRVGAVVKEFEDERERGDYLKRERDGLLRSWCSWCSSVIPTSSDVDFAN